MLCLHDILKYKIIFVMFSGLLATALKEYYVTGRMFQ